MTIPTRRSSIARRVRAASRTRSAAVGPAGLAALLVLLSASGGAATAGGPGGDRAGARPLPPPVQVRPEPAGVALGDPAFRPLPGARAEFGRLGGSVYQVEVPERWNGRLVLYLHGYGELGPTAEVSPPGIRR